MECVSALNSFLGGVHGVGTNPLAQASQPVSVRGVPSIGEAGVAVKGAVLQGLACFCVNHGEGDRLSLVAVQELGRCPSLNELGWEGAGGGRQGGDAGASAVCDGFTSLVCDVNGHHPWRWCSHPRRWHGHPWRRHSHPWSWHMLSGGGSRGGGDGRDW